jgi:hypothetical protein
MKTLVFPSQLPKILSDDGNDAPKECVTMVLDEACVGLSIICNLANLEGHMDATQRQLEESYKGLQAQIMKKGNRNTRSDGNWT